MFFANIHALLKRGVTLQLIVNAVDGEMIEVTVLPSTEKGTAGTGLVAKTFTATAAELDAEFPSIMQGYSQANTSLKDQLAAVEVMAAEASKAASEAVAAKANKSGTTKGRSNAHAKSEPRLTEGVHDEEDVDGNASNGTSGGDAVGDPSGGSATAPVAFTL